MKNINIVETINLNEIYSLLYHESSGAVNLFIGTVRNHAQGKGVEKLQFETYPEMAIKEMEKLAIEAEKRWPIHHIVMVHAIGEKKIGDPVVVIGVATSHRKESFEACEFLIDELKKTVPIWKKEFYEDSSIWVNAHP